jgi:hypothetical protein
MASTKILTLLLTGRPQFGHGALASPLLLLEKPRDVDRNQKPGCHGGKPVR